MLWAFDVGNTHTVVGLYEGTEWRHVWRLTTQALKTEDEWAADLTALCRINGLDLQAEGVVVGSVVPGADANLARLASKYLGQEAYFLRRGDQVGVTVTYDPPHAVGADRIANALASLAKHKPPIIVADFGTATTLDTIDREGHYVGGSIMPGLQVSLDALVQRTAKLPSVALQAPRTAIGRDTTGALQSGLVLGYAGAVESLVRRIDEELGGGSTILSTGGLGALFVDLCPSIAYHDARLTLEGLRLAHSLLGAQTLLRSTSP